MPIYDICCKDCDHVDPDVLMKVDEQPAYSCPDCGGQMIRAPGMAMFGFCTKNGNVYRYDHAKKERNFQPRKFEINPPGAR